MPRGRAQRIERLVVGDAPELRADLGLHDAGRDPDLAVHLADAAAQDVTGRRGRRRAARHGRHDERFGTVEHEEDLLRQRSRELVAAAAPPSTSNGRTTIGGLPATPPTGGDVLALEARDLAPLRDDDGGAPEKRRDDHGAIAPPAAPVSAAPRRRRLVALRRRVQHTAAATSAALGSAVRADDGVAAARQLDPHRIVAPFVGVVLDQAAAQAACLDADERIRLSIEVRRTTEHLDGDGIALEPIALAGERLLHDEAQKARRARGLLEAAARENPLELRAYLYRAGLHATLQNPALRCLREWDHLGRAPPTGIFATLIV